MSRLRRNPLRERFSHIREGMERLRKASGADGSREALKAARESIGDVPLRGRKAVEEAINRRLHARASEYPLNRFRDGPETEPKE